MFYRLKKEKKKDRLINRKTHSELRSIFGEHNEKQDQNSKGLDSTHTGYLRMPQELSSIIMGNLHSVSVDRIEQKRSVAFVLEKKPNSKDLSKNTL